MTEKSSKNLDQLRKVRNRDLIRRMRGNEPLVSYDNRSSWFPPRPSIEKDGEAIARLYGAGKDGTSTTDVEHNADEPSEAPDQPVSNIRLLRAE